MWTRCFGTKGRLCRKLADHSVKSTNETILEYDLYLKWQSVKQI